MPFNGAGTYSPPGADFPAVASTLIQSTKFNNVINDVASGLSNCITKDGQTALTANIPFAGFYATNLGIKAIAGAVGAPAIAWNDDPTSGWYRIGANDYGLAIAGTLRQEVTAALYTLYSQGLSVQIPAATAAIRAQSTAGGDKVVVTPQAAGVGGYIYGMNTGETDYAPLVLVGSPVTIAARNGVLTSTSVAVFQAPVASSVNYWDFRANNTGNPIQVYSQGPAGNSGMDFVSRGTGDIQFYSNGAGTAAKNFVIAGSTALNVNCWTVFGTTAGNGPSLVTSGTDANIGAQISMKGTGNLTFYSGGLTAPQFRIRGDLTTTVNFIDAFGAATLNSPQFRSEGTDVNIGLILSAKGTGAVDLMTNTSAQRQVSVAHVAAAVNYIQLAGAATANAVSIVATGTDANVEGYCGWKGAGAWTFYSHQDTGIKPQFRVDSTASSVNYWTVTGAATGNDPVFMITGTDVNVSGRISSRGTGNVNLLTNSNACLQVSIQHVASTVNYLTLKGATTGGNPVVSVDGSDTNVALTLIAKGTGYIVPLSPILNPDNPKQTLTDGATINWNMNAGQIATVTLGGNRTMAAPTNLKRGTYILEVIQDATGSRTMTWNAVFKWQSAIAPTLTTTASRRDVFSFYCDGTNLYGNAMLDVR